MSSAETIVSPSGIVADEHVVDESGHFHAHDAPVDLSHYTIEAWIAFVLFWVGALTYPVYLVHSSVLDAVSHGLPHANYAVKWLIGTAVVVLIAWILHMTVERAALEWRKSHTARPDV